MNKGIECKNPKSWGEKGLCCCLQVLAAINYEWGYEIFFLSERGCVGICNQSFLLETKALQIKAQTYKAPSLARKVDFLF